MSCIPLLMEPACSSSAVQGATKMRNNDAASRLLVPLSDDNEGEQSKSIQRKRVLPSWMLERDLLVQRVSKPVMTGGSRKKKGQGRGEGHTESLKPEVHVQQKKRLASEETIEDFEGGEQDQGKRSCLSIPVPSSQRIWDLGPKCATEVPDSELCSKRQEDMGQSTAPRSGWLRWTRHSQVTPTTTAMPLPHDPPLAEITGLSHNFAKQPPEGAEAPRVPGWQPGVYLILTNNTYGFPLENTMSDMEGNGKTGTKHPGSSLKKNDRQLHSKWSKREGQISSKDNRIEETENKEQITGSTSQQAHWDRTSQYFAAQEGILEPDANLDYNTELSDSATSADASENSKQIQHKRTPCMYGSGCYRKNPIHFQQFSHPNDDDYHGMEMVAQDDNYNQPECPYGTACYRKNPQHKLEYKHSAPPVTGRGTRHQTSSNGKRAVEKDGINDGEANEYDLNDSFIDEEEEEEEYEPTDEDSDWEPSSEEKDNEDVETLVQETRRFIRIKK